jgi:hypothetical protein
VPRCCPLVCLARRTLARGVLLLAMTCVLCVLLCRAVPLLQVPTDAELEAVLKQVQLHSLLDRCKAAAAAVAAVASSSDAAAAQQAATTTPKAAVATSSSTAVTAAAASTAAAAAAPPGTLASALDYVADWSGILSLGEQQRLAFARLLLAAPRLALLDEATSALDTKNEGLLYKVGRNGRHMYEVSFLAGGWRQWMDTPLPYVCTTQLRRVKRQPTGQRGRSEQFLRRPSSPTNHCACMCLHVRVCRLCWPVGRRSFLWATAPHSSATTSRCCSWLPTQGACQAGGRSCLLSSCWPPRLSWCEARARVSVDGAEVSCDCGQDALLQLPPAAAGLAVAKA